jgi:hypothetical protein
MQVKGVNRRHGGTLSATNKVLRSLEDSPKLDIFLTPADVALPNRDHDWLKVLVIREYKQNLSKDRSTKTLIQTLN